MVRPFGKLTYLKIHTLSQQEFSTPSYIVRAAKRSTPAGASTSGVPPLPWAAGRAVSPGSSALQSLAVQSSEGGRVQSGR